MVVMPLRNTELSATTVHTGELVGLEQALETYTSDDVISTNLAEELLIAYASTTHERNTPQIPESLSSDQQIDLQKLIAQFADIFATPLNLSGRTNLVKHRIEVPNTRPIRQPQRPVPYARLSVSMPVGGGMAAFFFFCACVRMCWVMEDSLMDPRR